MGILSLLDNIIRAALLVASAVSFYPQIHKIVSGGNSAGISLAYLLLSTVSAIEQFTLYSGHFLFNESYPDSEVSTPPTFGDWLNFLQMWAPLLGTTATFAVAIWHPPSRQFEKTTVILGYLAFASVSIVPMFAYFSKSVRDHDQWGPDMFLSVHTYWVNWFVTAGIFPLSLFCQWLVMQGRPVPQSLSVKRLAVQAVVFLLMGVSWTRRMTIDRPTWAEWYEYVGYATVDNFLFGVVQALLLAFVLLWRIAEGEERPHTSQDEASPLLSN